MAKFGIRSIYRVWVKSFFAFEVRALHRRRAKHKTLKRIYPQNLDVECSTSFFQFNNNKYFASQTSCEGTVTTKQTNKQTVTDFLEFYPTTIKQDIYYVWIMRDTDFHPGRVPYTRPPSCAALLTSFRKWNSKKEKFDWCKKTRHQQNLAKGYISQREWVDLTHRLLAIFIMLQRLCANVLLFSQSCTLY